MNILKHMEAVFLAAVVLAGVASYASAAIPAAQARYDAQVSIGERQTAVVTVSARRLDLAAAARG